MATLILSEELTQNLSESLVIGNLSQQVVNSNSTFAFTPILPYDFYVNSATSGNEIDAYLKICSGEVPTDLDGLTTPTSRDADTLITFPIRLVNVFNENSVYNTNPVVINTEYVTANSDGTATWFRLYSFEGSNVIHQIVGTVDVPEQDPDLELGDVEIVSGLPYKISNFRLLFPTTFTY